MPASPFVVLSIAGSDSSAGAGIQADLKTISALGGYGLTAVTSVVSETPGLVSRFQLLDPDLIADQIRVVCAGFPVAAAKTGMLGGTPQVLAVVDAWKTHGKGVPLVVDPVMVATSGGRLLEEDAIVTICQHLLPLATVITPNLAEAAVLWNRPVTSRDEMAACAEELAARYQTAVLVKGGHLHDDGAADVLGYQGDLIWFESTRVPDVQTHGTGCTFSAAIASSLASGADLHIAVGRAKEFVTTAIDRFFQWTSSNGSPLHALNHLAQHEG